VSRKRGLLSCCQTAPSPVQGTGQEGSSLQPQVSNDLLSLSLGLLPLILLSFLELDTLL
jgi:hypothetical protein